MIPIIRAESDNALTANTTLVDVVSCYVTEVRNGEYTLEMQYPVGGRHWEMIAPDMLLNARVDDDARVDYFRIYSVEKSSDGLMTIRANQLCYDLAWVYRTGRAYTGTAGTVLDNVIDNAFGFYGNSDVAGTGQIEVTSPASVRAIIGGGEGSILDVYGGELEWFRRTVTLHKARGRKKNVTLAYGENITKIVAEENSLMKYRGVMGYAAYTDANGDSKYVTYTAMYPQAPADTFRLHLIDFTDEMPSADLDQSMTQTIVTGKVSQYVNSHQEYKNAETESVEFVPRWYDDDYDDERITLCDTVTLSYAPFGIEKSVKVVKTVYDVVQERYTRITVGEVVDNFVDTVVQGNQAAGLTKAETSLFPQRWTRDIQDAIAPYANIGERVHDDTSVSLSSGTTLQNIASFSLTKGTWMVSISVRFAANATGRRAINLANTSGGSALNLRWGNGTTAVSGAYTYLHLASSLVITGSQQTYFINAYQSSGGALATEVGWDCIRIT